MLAEASRNKEVAQVDLELRKKELELAEVFLDALILYVRFSSI